MNTQNATPPPPPQPPRFGAYNRDNNGFPIDKNGNRICLPLPPLRQHDAIEMTNDEYADFMNAPPHPRQHAPRYDTNKT